MMYHGEQPLQSCCARATQRVGARIWREKNNCRICATSKYKVVTHEMREKGVQQYVARSEGKKRGEKLTTGKKKTICTVASSPYKVAPRESHN